MNFKQWIFSGSSKMKSIGVDSPSNTTVKEKRIDSRYCEKCNVERIMYPMGF